MINVILYALFVRIVISKKTNTFVHVFITKTCEVLTCSWVSVFYFQIARRAIIAVSTDFFYLYEVLGPGREDLSGQWSVWCSRLLNLP